MFNYCPNCQAELDPAARTKLEQSSLFLCCHCGFTFYLNTAAATGLIICCGAAIVLVERAEEPAKGKLDLPGGFVNPGEGVFEGLRRECQEELGWAEVADAELFASFPNVYRYKDVNYNTCDLFFTLTVPELPQFHIDPAEIAGVRLVFVNEIRLEDLAFDGHKRAITAYIEKYHGKPL
ncbi:NUDIX hydrolase [Breznakiellaceae bacterium SP9]